MSWEVFVYNHFQQIDQSRDLTSCVIRMTFLRSYPEIRRPSRLPAFAKNRWTAWSRHRSRPPMPAAERWAARDRTTCVRSPTVDAEMASAVGEDGAGGVGCDGSAGATKEEVWAMGRPPHRWPFPCGRRPFYDIDELSNGWHAPLPLPHHLGISLASILSHLGARILPKIGVCMCWRVWERECVCESVLSRRLWTGMWTGVPVSSSTSSSFSSTVPSATMSLKRAKCHLFNKKVLPFPRIVGCKVKFKIGPSLTPPNALF